MKKIEAIIKPTMMEPVKEALFAVGIRGMTISEVQGCGNQHGHTEFFRGAEVVVNMLPKVKFEIITTDERVEQLVQIIQQTANNGEVGDGKIFVLPIEQVVRVRTGESGEAAI
ncbi:MAG: P-II family nitrogen regulator [Coriobacteriales bacterium]|jgi:nitrogen regulatory protein P-II 1|nr:P-II family nitrogen regulator [Coriobacteriales bacterium]